MKQIIPLLLFIAVATSLFGEISVKSFRKLETDLDARVNEPIKDFNGNLSAIIKVVTTQTGFSFDCGQIGVVKTVNKPAEIWVYVPYSTKHISISHPEFGMLRDYRFDQPIVEATVYELVIISEKVEVIVKKETPTSEISVNSTLMDMHVIAPAPLFEPIEKQDKDNTIQSNSTEQSIGAAPSTLNSIEKYGKDITIQSTPTNMPLSIDGNIVGKTPYVARLLDGNHTLQIENGAKKQEMHIIIAPWSQKNNTYHLYFTNELKDVDGNVYQTLKIGTQVWMLENLKTTHYRNGDEIPLVPNANEWSKLNAGASCAYNNDPNAIDKFGLLYNWSAVTDHRGIAPQGWHVASKDDYDALVQYLISHGFSHDGSLGENLIANSLAATTNWRPSYSKVGVPGYELKSNNRTGFSGLPAGIRNSSGHFEGLASIACWWTCSMSSSQNSVYTFQIQSDKSNSIFVNQNKNSGFAIRCIKN